jgi:hypothetical protein
MIICDFSMSTANCSHQKLDILCESAAYCESRAKTMRQFAIYNPIKKKKKNHKLQRSERNDVLLLKIQDRGM